MSLSQALMFCKVMYKDVLSNESYLWICNELDHYESADSLPEYRVINCSVKAVLSGYYAGARIVEVDTSPIDRIMRERGQPSASPNKMLVRQGIESIESSLDKIGSDVQLPLLQEQVDVLLKYYTVSPGWKVERMFQECSGEYIRVIIPAVRNRLISIFQDEILKNSRVENKQDPSIERKRIFISYGWDDEQHCKWVRSLADRLSEFFDVRIDEQTPYGTDLNTFMEQMISTSDRVLLILTPKYKEKADARMNGVGYESVLISSELYRNQGTTKFLPIIRRGSVPKSYPLYLGSRKGLDMTEGRDFDAMFAELVEDIKRY